jgi:hypothetical protein
MVQHDMPEVSMLVGAPLMEDWHVWKSEEIAARLGGVLGQQLDEHKSQLVRIGQGSLPGAVSLIRNGRSTSEKYDAARKRGVR